MTMAARLGAGKKKLEELERNITCPICQEHYTDPKLLPCNHYYCRECIIRLANKPVFHCPECRKEITLKDGVERLQSAFFVHTMKSTYTAMKELYEEKHGPAGNATKESLPQPSTMNCLLHNATLDIYCHNCKSLICYQCSWLGHNQHVVDPIKKAASDMKMMLLNKLNPLEEEEKCMSSAIQAVVATKNKVEDQRKEAACRIKDSFRELHKILERREQQMLLDCEYIVKTKLESLSKQENDLNNKFKQTKTAMDHFKSLVGNSTNTELLTQHSQVQHQIGLKVQEHCKNKKTTAPVEEADLNVEVNMAQKLQTLCHSFAVVTTLNVPPCYLELPDVTFSDEWIQVTLTAFQRQAYRVSCRIEHLASKNVMECEVRNRGMGSRKLYARHNFKYSVSYCDPLMTGDYEMIATVNGQDLPPRHFKVKPRPINIPGMGIPSRRF